MTKWKLGLLGSNILLDKNLMDSWYLRLFDKLINWSFIFPKHFSSNPAHILKQWPSLRLAEAHEPSWHLAFFNAFEEMFPWGPRSITYEAEFKAMDFTVPEQSTGGACVFKVYFPGCLEHLWDHQSSKDQGPGQGSLLLLLVSQPSCSSLMADLLTIQPSVLPEPLPSPVILNLTHYLLLFL